jgi:uncharacterized membrane protein
MKKNLSYLYGSIGLCIFSSLWISLHISLGSWILIPIWFFLGIIFSGSLVFAQFLDARKFSFSEWLIYVSGFGLLTLIILGLTLNTIGLNIHHATLTTDVVMVALDILFIILSLSVIARKRILHLIPASEATTTVSKFVTFVPFLFPLVSVLGANRLNNGASASLSIGLYIFMIVFAGIIIASKKLHNEYVLSSSLWGISFAILLSVSMRSNHLIGYDINQEFQVFSATLKNGLWHPHLFQNTYNACLSITILPTVLKDLMPISPDYIFKFVMQGIFSFAPIGVYVLAKYFMENWEKKATYAFISALFFVVQYQFLNEFPALIREQVATIFFALIFISATNASLKKSTKSALILLFGVGMIVSHYSTAYICLGLLILVLLIKPIIQRLVHLKSLRNSGWHISPLLVLILFLFSFLWYAELLSSTGGVIQKVESSVTNFGQIFSSDSRSPFVNTTFGLGGYSETPQTLKQASLSRQSSYSYTDSTKSDYQVSPALTPAPQINNGYQNLLLKTLNKYIPALIKLVVILGLASIIFASFKGARYAEEGALVIAAGIIFVLMVILPSLSQDYNIERLYQQLLIFISSSFVIGSLLIIKYSKLKYAEASVFLLLSAYFLCTSGVVSQIAFGISNINFDNFDLNYVHFYSLDGDIDSLKWLQSAYHQHPSIIDIDEYSKLKTYSNTVLPADNLVPGLLPTQIGKSAYVYASSTNLRYNIVFDSYNNQVLSYTFPGNFLNSNKNTIYSDGDSMIYR